MLKRVAALALSLGLLVMLVPGAADAAIRDFTGTWRNVDSDTRNLTRLEIRRNGGRVFVHVYGACSPTDCDNGEHRAIVFAPSVSSRPQRDASALFVQYNAAPGRYRLVLRTRGNRLSYQLFAQFTDGSNRTNYEVSGSMRKVSGGGGGAGNRPPLQEDCVSFNPRNAEVVRRQGRWKIVDGNNWLFDFANNRREAEQSLQVIQNYAFNRACYVGRPDPSMVYLKRGNRVPGGRMPGQDCIRHDASNYTIRQDGANRWLLTDGRSRIKVFPNRREARLALRVIERYSLNRLCYVGRPGPSFEYWLSGN